MKTLRPINIKQGKTTNLNNSLFSEKKKAARWDSCVSCVQRAHVCVEGGGGGTCVYIIHNYMYVIAPDKTLCKNALVIGL